MSKSYISCYTCMVEHISQGNWYYYNTNYVGFGMYREWKKIEFPKKY